MSTVYLGRLYRFNAGHRLSRPDRDPDWNLEVFGKCSYEGGHGHNYDLEVVIRGAPDPLTGQGGHIYCTPGPPWSDRIGCSR